MPKVLIIDNYDSFTYNLVQLVKLGGVRNFDLVKNDKVMSLREHYDKVLISPGPGVASEAGEVTDYLKANFDKSSFLGICLGFEAIVEFFGGIHQKLPKPLHGYRNKGKIIKRHDVLKGLPEEFYIGHYHSWFTVEESLPEELEILIKDELGLIMAVAHKKYDLTGLQFHPESVMTEYGKEMICNWLKS
jgi:anthranilate synthase component 2